jgi:hypothetical protein
MDVRAGIDIRVVGERLNANLAWELNRLRESVYARIQQKMNEARVSDQFGVWLRTNDTKKGELANVYQRVLRALRDQYHHQDPQYWERFHDWRHDKDWVDLMLCFALEWLPSFLEECTKVSPPAR